VAADMAAAVVVVAAVAVTAVAVAVAKKVGRHLFEDCYSSPCYSGFRVSSMSASVIHDIAHSSIV
jgi:hypothetical protein